MVIDPEVYTVHDVTGTLKQFFRSLPDPLLTHQLYQSFITTMRKRCSYSSKRAGEGGRREGGKEGGGRRKGGKEEGREGGGREGGRE